MMSIFTEVFSGLTVGVCVVGGMSLLFSLYFVHPRYQHSSLLENPCVSVKAPFCQHRSFIPKLTFS